MRPIVRVAMLATLICAGCAGPIVSSGTVAKAREGAGAPAIESSVLEQLPVDRYCEVDLRDPHNDRHDSYLGRIVSVQANQVTLDEVTHHARTINNSPLARSRIAWLRRLAKNTGVGMEAIEGQHALAREQIAQISVLDDERENAYRLQRADWVQHNSTATAEATAEADRLAAQRGSSPAAEH